MDLLGSSSRVLLLWRHTTHLPMNCSPGLQQKAMCSVHMPAVFLLCSDGSLSGSCTVACCLEQELPLCKGAPLCATGCCLLLCTQVVEEWFSKLAEDLLTPAPICVEGSWQVLDAMSSLFVCLFVSQCSGSAVHGHCLNKEGPYTT